MASRTQSDRDDFAILVESDGTTPRTVEVEIRLANGHQPERYVIDIVAASQAAAASIGGGRTAAEVRECLRRFAIACRASARAQGGLV